MVLAYGKWLFLGFAILAPIGVFFQDFGTPRPEEFSWIAAAALTVVFLAMSWPLSHRFQFSRKSSGFSERMIFGLGATVFSLVGCIGLIRLWHQRLLYWHIYTILYFFCVVWGTSLLLAIWLNGRANQSADRKPGSNAPGESGRQ